MTVLANLRDRYLRQHCLVTSSRRYLFVD